jgi:hypothetical protein
MKPGRFGDLEMAGVTAPKMEMFFPQLCGFYINDGESVVFKRWI